MKRKVRKRFSKLKKRANNRSGFTLAEVLIAMLILLMVSGIVAAGIPAAANSYQKVVNASNAETVMSTAISMLRSELGSAKDIVVSDGGKKISYFNTGRMADSEISVSSPDANGPKPIMINKYASISSNASEQLISAGRGTQMNVTFSAIAYVGTTGIITISGLQVYQGKTGIGNPRILKIRVIDSSN